MSLWTARSRAAVVTARAVLPSGAASNLFWFGRYIERAEQCLRLLRTVLDANPFAFDVSDRNQRACAGELLGVLAHLTSTNLVIGEDSALRVERLPEIVIEIFDPSRFGNVAHALSAALQAAQSVRDRLDGDAWRMIHTFRGHLETLSTRGGGPVPALLDEIDALIGALAALGGLLSETLIRGQSWLFLDLGKRVERALALIALLRITLLAGREPALANPPARGSLAHKRESHHLSPPLPHAPTGPSRPRIAGHRSHSPALARLPDPVPARARGCPAERTDTPLGRGATTGARGCECGKHCAHGGVSAAGRSGGGASITPPGSVPKSANSSHGAPMPSESTTSPISTAHSSSYRETAGCKNALPGRAQDRICLRAPVALCHNEVHLQPRSCERQSCIAHELDIYPVPESVSEREDFFGNPVCYLRSSTATTGSQ